MQGPIEVTKQRTSTVIYIGTMTCKGYNEIVAFNLSPVKDRPFSTFSHRQKRILLLSFLMCTTPIEDFPRRFGTETWPKGI